MSKFKVQNYLLLILALFLFGGLKAEAARIYFEPQELVIGTEKEFLVAVNIDAEDSINALSAAISISEALIPYDINEANSIISLWFEKPNWDETTRLLTFSGIIPGGFQGKGARLLVMKFKVEGKEEAASLSFDKEKTEVFLNTPEGIKDSLELDEIQLPVVKGKENLRIELPDVEPPELFILEVAQDPNVFNGKYFLVFTTQDKGSGIAGYAVHESTQSYDLNKIGRKNIKWEKAESPHVLRDQELESYIYVKAVDKAGNERIVMLGPRNPHTTSYEDYSIWVIIIIIGTFLFLILKYLWRRKFVNMG